MKRNVYTYIGSAYCILWMGTMGCKTPQVAQIPQLKEIPSHETQTTTQDIPDLTLKQFFKDDYLIQLLKKAQKNNPDIHILQQNVWIASTVLQQSRKAFFPILSIDALTSGTKYGKYTMEGVGNFDTNLSDNIEEDQKIKTNPTPNHWLGLKTSWEIDLWGRLKQLKESAQMQYFSTKEGLRLMQNEILGQVADLYFDLIALDNKEKILQRNVTLQNEILNIIKIQREVGKVTELPVKQFQASVVNSEAHLEEVRAEKIRTERALLSLIGEYEGDILFDTTFKNISHEWLTHLRHLEDLIHKRPDVQQAYYQLQASHADAKAARSAMLPRLELGGYWGLNSFSAATFINPASMAWQLLGNITMPVFQQKQLASQFAIRNYEQQIAFYKYQQAVTRSYNELQSIIGQARQYEKILALKQQESLYLDSAIHISNDLYTTGFANYLELLTSQKNKLDADLLLVDYQLQQAKLYVLLFKALGGLMLRDEEDKLS
ncbi:TolC family protein [Niabella digestorum]|uniref:TolC family protein n=1 Tax=Niabella digestorum TaxID=3117701 RepID=A0ABU7RH39_9BACT